jgi:integrase
MRYAMQHDAMASNPCHPVDFDGRRATGDHENFEHHPLTAQQVAQLSAAVAGKVDDLPAYPVMVEFLAYSGLRASENVGLEIQDLDFTTRPGQPTRCRVQVRRTKDRKGGERVVSTPKSRRSVPLPSWLAERMHAYLAEHPRAR